MLYNVSVVLATMPRNRGHPNADIAVTCGGFGGLPSEHERVRITVDDGELEVLDEGAGTPLVLLHAFPLASETWDAQARELAAGARVVRIDLRGLGGSRGGPGPYLMESLASDVASVLDVLGIERAAVIGHSLGTHVAFSFFRMFEERVLGLGLVCGRADADSVEAAAQRQGVADEIERSGMASLAASFTGRCFAPATVAHRPDLVERVRTIVLRTRPAGAAAIARGMALRSAADDLFEEMNVPVLVVSGRHDVLVPPRSQEEMAQAIRGARLVTLETGHLPQFEAPGALGAALCEFAGAL